VPSGFRQGGRETPMTVIDAIKESRMTSREIKLLDQIQKETLANRRRIYARMRARSTKQADSTLSLPDSVPSTRSLVSDGPKTSADTAVQTETIAEEGPRTTKSGGLTIDTSVANVAVLRPALTVTHESGEPRLPSAETENVVPKHVSTERRYEVAPMNANEDRCISLRIKHTGLVASSQSVTVF
jgi:hypothetical protein